VRIPGPRSEVAHRLQRLTDRSRGRTRRLVVGHLRLRAAAGRVPASASSADSSRGCSRSTSNAAASESDGRVLSAGFDSDIVYDLREYATFPSRGCTTTSRRPKWPRAAPDQVSGHTVIDSIEAITRLERGVLSALRTEYESRARVHQRHARGGRRHRPRMINPTPNAVILHGLEEEDLWTTRGNSRESTATRWPSRRHRSTTCSSTS